MECFSLLHDKWNLSILQQLLPSFCDFCVFVRIVHGVLKGSSKISGNVSVWYSSREFLHALGSQSLFLVVLYQSAAQFSVHSSITFKFLITLPRDETRYYS